MEIDEHLKYTLYVFLLYPCRSLLIYHVACSSTRARELVSLWCLAGLRTTSFKVAPYLMFLKTAS